MSDSSKMSIGQRLFLLRGDMSRKVFAEKLGIGTATLQRYENNERKPDLDFLMKLQDLYGISLDYLVYGNKNVTLSNDEHTILEKYRDAPLEVKSKVLMLLLSSTVENKGSVYTIQEKEQSNLTSEQVKDIFKYLVDDTDTEEDTKNENSQGIFNSPNSSISNSFNK